MKYTSKVKSEQTIQIDGGKTVVIQPGSGEMSEADALSVAKTPWGKRLIETGYLAFEKPVEVKDEKIERGMTLKPGEKKPGKPPENAGEKAPGPSKNGGAAQ
jgi:hypothetical protein